MVNRKEQIVNRATYCIKKHGYDSFSYKDLSDMVGITKATLHHHFPKKEDLGIAVCERIKMNFEDLTNQIDQLQEAKEKFIFLMENLPNELGEGDICPISSLQSEYNIIPASMQALITQLCNIEYSLLLDILEAGRADGSFKFSGSPESMAMVIITAYKGALQYSRAMNNDVIGTVVEQIFKLVLSNEEISLK